jgi:ubiquitin carboxyl-terminal hydrolase L3
MVKHWIPLESNPEVLTDYAAKLGVTTVPDTLSFCDIFGLDDDLLAMVPSPVLAVLLLFPITAETEKLRKEGAFHLCFPQFH